MRRTFSSAGACALALGVAVAAASAPAAAQTTSGVTLQIDKTQFYRFKADGSSLTRTYPTPNERAITKVDCDEDSQVQVIVNGQGNCGNCPVEVWAAQKGDDCTDRNLRSGPNRRCWRAGLGYQFATGGQPQNLRVQDLLRDWGDSTEKLTNYTPGTAEACNVERFSPIITAVEVFFMITDGGAGVRASDRIELPVKMRGPQAPTLGRLSAVDGQITAEFSLPGQNTDIRGYVAYCRQPPGEEVPEGFVPPPGKPACPLDPFGPPRASSSAGSSGSTTEDPADAGTTRLPLVLRQAQDPDAGDGDAGDDAGDGEAGVTDDAGGVADASEDASVEGPNACGSSGGGTPEVIDSKYECGRVENNIASSLKIRGGTAGYAYAVAVAAYDVFGVVGEPSSYGCTCPVEVKDFWGAYREAGGRGGGGFCALEGAGMPTGIGGLALVAGVGMLGAARRRRRS